MLTGFANPCMATPENARQYASHTHQAPRIDGVDDEPQWQQAQWYPMPYLMAGTEPGAEDFQGRYRLLWDADYLYLQAEIVDDVLFDSHANPLEAYWDDDALEVFIDSDASGGLHQTNHSAFAYHIALDNQAVDIGDDGQPHRYNAHLRSAWRRGPTHIVWEVAIKLYPKNYTDAKPLPPLRLQPSHVLGFMLAYCDNDGSPVREHFKGSHLIAPVNGDRNRGYIDASVFGQVQLLPPRTSLDM